MLSYHQPIEYFVAEFKIDSLAGVFRYWLDDPEMDSGFFKTGKTVSVTYQDGDGGWERKPRTFVVEFEEKRLGSLEQAIQWNKIARTFFFLLAVISGAGVYNFHKLRRRFLDTTQKHAAESGKIQ